MLKPISGLLGLIAMAVSSAALTAAAEDDAATDGAALQTVDFGTKGEADGFKIDTSMPDFPALALLGQDQSALTNITTPEDLGSHLFNQFDEDGDLKLGFALGGHPYWWFGGDDLTLSEYAGDIPPGPQTGQEYRRVGALERKLARLNVSFGVIELTEGETASDTTGFKTALGLSTEWFDSADPRFDQELRNCVRAEMQKWHARADFNAPKAIALKAALDVLQKADGFTAFASQNNIAIPRPTGDDALDQEAYGDLIGALAVAEGGTKYVLIFQRAYNDADEASDYSAVFDEMLTKGLEACKKKAAVTLQTKQSLRLGVAVAARSESGRADDMEQDGAAFWASYRLPLGQSGEGALSSFGAFVKYEIDANDSFSGANIPAAVLAETSMGETPPETVLASYNGLRAGVNINRVRDDFVISGALAYVDKNFERDVFEDEDYLLATMTTSLKIREGIWAEASFGWADDAKFDAHEFAGIRLKVDWNRFGGN